jgi:hypothetical protein
VLFADIMQVSMRSWNDSDLRLLGRFELGGGMLENSLIEGWKVEGMVVLDT